MCGIYGIIYKNNQKVNIANLKSCVRLMAHRGPDGEGFYVDKNVGLGHKRLSIIDIKSGSQPMYALNGKLLIVFNGEIYNYVEIRQELIKKGCTFDTCSDTEVILWAYYIYGPKCIGLFRGMFVFAIYDKREKSIFIVRDRIGIKPLYLYEDSDKFIFSSEIKPILKTENVTPEINESSLNEYVNAGYVYGKHTMFKNINKLLPGNYLIYQDDNYTEKEYWDCKNISKNKITFDTALLQFEDILKESVSLRLRSDVPLGAFLSGGIDSSMIVALMSSLQTSAVKTYSVGYEDAPESNELEYAKKVAEQFNCDHHEFILSPLNFFDSIDIFLNHVEEPITEPAAIALYQIAALARKNAIVLLSGEGGDEILAGYPLYQKMRKIHNLRRMGFQIPVGILKVLWKNKVTEKQLKYLDWLILPFNERYQTISNDVTPSIKKNIFTPEFLIQHSDNSNYFADLLFNVNRCSELNRMLYADLKSWLPDRLLIKADKMTMAASIELRVPFLDHKLVEFSACLPDNFKIRHGHGKYLLKILAEKYLPKNIIYRRKQGFPVPIERWFRGKLCGQIEEILLDESVRKKGYFNMNYIRKIIDKNRNGQEDFSKRIASLVIFELWYKKYIQN